ncbi:MAG: uridine kinase [Dehalococcoidia bacterium]
MRVAITGPSAAGKTTLADELAQCLAASGREVHRCEFDDFHRPGHKWRSVRGEWTGRLYYDEGYDYEAFRRLVLEPLGLHGSRRCRFSLFSSFLDQPMPETWTDVGETAVVVVDGGLLLHPAIGPSAWDQIIWVEVDEETLLARASLRDGAWGADPDPSAISRRYEQYHLPCHRIYKAETGGQTLADVVVDNSDPSAPALTMTA